MSLFRLSARLPHWRSCLARSPAALATAMASSTLLAMASTLPPALVPLPRHTEAAWWLPRHEAKLREARSLRPDIVLLGDSITHNWEGPGRAAWEAYWGGHPTLNLGFSGDRTENVLWRLREGAMDGLDPKLTILLIGTNNTGYRMDPAADTAAGIRAILDEVRNRAPNSKLLLLAIFPRGTNAADPVWRRNQAVNERIAEYADGERIHFLDINDSFTTGDAAMRTDLLPDYVHPNASGYEVWAERMQATVTGLMRD
ncbi:MAG: GDSL-type esterase/lipase family protein [Opitutales bacterium]